MHGHEPLIALRLRGQRPTLVGVHIGPDRDWLASHWQEWEGLTPHLLIEPADSIASLDLRCLVGLMVDVSGDVSDAPRVRRVFDACVAAGASRVMGALHRTRGEIFEVVEHMDSAGVLTW